MIFNSNRIASLQLWKFAWIPHLSSGKLVLCIATFFGLLLGADDLVGSARANSWAALWLANGTNYFSVLTRHVHHSAMLLRIVAIVCVFTVLGGALSMLVVYFLLGVASLSNHMPAMIAVMVTVPLLCLALLAFSMTLVFGYRLDEYFESEDVSKFLKEHSEFLEARIMSKIAEGVRWAIEETERNSYRNTPTGLPSTPYEIRMPLPGVLSVAWIATTFTLILSVTMRTASLLVSGTIWLLGYAPAQALNAVAKRTGADNYIKVGKYVVCIILSVYGLLHD